MVSEEIREAEEKIRMQVVGEPFEESITEEFVGERVDTIPVSGKLTLECKTVGRVPAKRVLPREPEFIPVKVVEDRFGQEGGLSIHTDKGYHPLSGLSDEDIEHFKAWSDKFYKEHLTPEQIAKSREDLKKFIKGAKSTILHYVDAVRGRKAKEKMEEVVPTVAQ